MSHLMALENFKVLGIKNYTSEITSSRSCETYIFYTQQWPKRTQKPFWDPDFIQNLYCSIYSHYDEYSRQATDISTPWQSPQRLSNAGLIRATATLSWTCATSKCIATIVHKALVRTRELCDKITRRHRCWTDIKTAWKSFGWRW